MALRTLCQSCIDEAARKSVVRTPQIALRALMKEQKQTNQEVGTNDSLNYHTLLIYLNVYAPHC